MRLFQITHKYAPYIELFEQKYQIRERQLSFKEVQVFDRGSMQKSMEVRMSFMDWRLVYYVFSLTSESKIGNSFTKRTLRDSMVNIMPKSIRNRKLKVGMSLPMPQWFGNEIKPLILNKIKSISFNNGDLWGAKSVTKFVKNRMKNRSWTYDKFSQFWTILNTHILIQNTL